MPKYTPETLIDISETFKFTLHTFLPKMRCKNGLVDISDMFKFTFYIHIPYIFKIGLENQ